VADDAGKGHTGTLSNASWSASGKFNGALAFNGSTTSLVNEPDASSLHLTAGMTLEAWVDPSSLNSPDQGWDAVIAKEHRNSANDISYALYAANGTGTGPAVHILVGGRDYGAQGSSVLPLNTWTFLAGTYDGHTLKMYVNGNLVGSVSVSGNIFSTTDPLRLGGDWSGEMFTGLVDNVRIYNKALTQTQIQQDMNSPVIGSTTTGPPVASAGPRLTTNEGSAVTFAGWVTGGASPLTYSWNFGDGHTTTGSLTPSHTYTSDGTYTATLTVTDGQGRSSQSSTTVTVNNVAPAVNAGGPYSGTPGTALAFSGTATVPDAKDSLTYSWNFGDNTTATGRQVSHTYANAGTYTVTLTATDQEGASTSVTTTATVTSTGQEVFPNNLNVPPLPAPAGNVVNVSTVSQLQAAVANLQSGQTIMIAAGTYNLTGTLYVPQGISNVAIRGATGNANDVVIQGDAVIDASPPYSGSAIWGPGSGISGTIPFGIWVGNVQGVTIADMTLRNYVDDAIILNAGAQSPLIHNVVMTDVGEQFIKSNPDGSGGGVNNGIVEYCTMQYTTAAPNNYTNGIDLHTTQNWIIRNNVFRNIFTTNPATTLGPGALAGPAILVWNGSSNCTTVDNTFINCQREIAYGLSDPSSITNDNTGGLIANNFIYRSGSQHGDVAIGVWNSPSTEVAYNTVILNGDYVNAIEYRFATSTGVKILYNLTDAAITQRDGASGTVTGNLTSGVQPSWFANEGIGDLHLTAAATGAIGHGAFLPEVPTDYDGQARPSSGPTDIGADEFGTSAAPTVVSRTPANGATGISQTTSVTVTFSEAVDPTTVNGTTIQLLDPSNNLVAATINYYASTDTATLTPSSSLAMSTTYTVVVDGGSSGPAVKDLAGNPLAANDIWSFTTDAPAAPPVASAGNNIVTSEGTPVTFAGSATGGQPALSYSWNFGDNTIASGTLTPTHTYANSGTYTATLTVTDSLNRTSTSSLVVTVNDAGPTSSAGGSYAGTPGTAIAFSGSATDPSPLDTAAGFTWLWNFGDNSTSTLQNPTHTYAVAGTYTVTFTATSVRDGASRTATTSATITNAALAPQTIVTPYDKIPNFGFQPTIVSVSSGNWSNPATWSLGRLPTTGDIVDIMPGDTVTYDINSNAALNTLAIQAGASLKFRTDINTQVVVGNFEVLPGGSMEIGTQANPVAANVQANIVIANQAINTTLDPEQFGTGLIVLGKMTSYGAAKTPFVTLIQEAHAGDTVLHLASPISGWQAGDGLCLPDTRQLDDSTRGSSYQPQWEELTIQSVSADGLTVTLTAPLRYDHLGARDANGILDYLPQVLNRDRNVMIGSQDEGNDPGQTRGYALFTGRADVNINYTGFCELGRTTATNEDDTTFDSNGNVTHIGTNEGDRTPMTAHNLIGPTTAQADGYQFTFVGNVVDDNGSRAESNQTHLWGIVLNNSHYGLIQNNVVYNVAGAGIGTENGNETGNVFDHNFVLRVTGSGGRTAQWLRGDGYWFHNPDNVITNNFASDINGGAWDNYAYGFDVDVTYVGTQTVPVSQGADPAVNGRSVNENALPLRQFSNNQVYGATLDGMAYWWLGTNWETPLASAGTIQSLVVWHQTFHGVFGYESNNLTIDGFVGRGDIAETTNAYNYSDGLYFGDYMTRGAIVENADIQNEATGINVPESMGHNLSGSTFTLENSYLDNVTDVNIGGINSSNGGAGLAPRTTIIQNVQFAHPAGVNPSWLFDISMDDSMNSDPGFYNRTVADLVYVYSYNGNPNDKFQVFYSDRSPANATTRARIGGRVLAL
jgi:PKD repeat protein